MRVNDINDTNGNMIHDPGKDNNIEYKYLNLPEHVYYEEDALKKIYYYYDATGTKRTQEINSSGWQVNMHYLGNIVYEDDKIAYILTSEGYVKPEEADITTTWRYEYQLKGHLGNTRVTISDLAAGNAVEVLQHSNYYPFGLAFEQKTIGGGNQNKYLHNGKELQDNKLGAGSLNWYDYGARMYDAQLGRWHVVDPLGELVPGINPYNYCFNNPIILTDPTGMFPEDESPYLASTFIKPDGTIIDVREDGDRNIYLVHDPDNWDGSKDGLATVGHTPEDNTLEDYKGENLYSEEVAGYMFDEAERLNIEASIYVNAFQVGPLAEVLKHRDEVLKLLDDLEKAEIEQLTILLEMIKLKLLLLNEEEKQTEGFAWLQKRMVVRLSMSLYGRINLPGDEATEFLFPESMLDEIINKYNAKRGEIIRQYDDRIRGVQNGQALPNE